MVVNVVSPDDDILGFAGIGLFYITKFAMDLVWLDMQPLSLCHSLTAHQYLMGAPSDY